MAEKQKRSVLFRKPRSGRDFVVVGAMVVLGTVLGTVIAALRSEDPASYLANMLPLALAAAIPVAALVLAVFWRVRNRKGQS
ncbi:hypothetical protein MF406_01705 [Georgenia sp. TF02-10]|uniref:hypothetical protein n=1 Tax=Georgenia sp. TF02-10 TaxID=2917725 RepID=UPI001FA79442|nr:hypothetical protein [Georgenia sp. TF02-10]UNX55028.1 hypothetical protein MF406_01705 [Georgenia sp. TF02-10]